MIFEVRKLMHDNNDMIKILSEAEELINQHNYHKAIELLEKNLSYFENEEMFLNFLVRLHLYVGDTQSALNYLNRSLEIEQENLTTLDLSGDVFAKLKDWDQAILSWKKVSELDEKRYHVWKKIGNLYYEIGEYHEAVQAFNNFLEYEEDIELYSFLASIFKKMGNEIESWNNLMKAEKLDSDNEKILIQIGETYFDLDNHERAKDYYKKATEVNPDSIPAWFQLGKSLEATQDFIQAVESFSKVIELDPDNVLGFFNLAKIYAALANIEEATRYYEECLSRDPAFLEATLALASLSWASKNYDKAIAYLNDSLRYNENENRIFQMLGDIYEDNGEEEKALEFWEKATELEE